MRPTTAPKTQIRDLECDALVHPGTVFDHPREVVAHPALSLSEKRAILVSWASDASAIASRPDLRVAEGLKKPVSIDEILDALVELGRGPQPPGGKPMRLRSIDRLAA